MATTHPRRLTTVGPTSGAHGFPLWYADDTGERLALALDPGDANAPAMGELPVPGAPVAFPGNFPDEAFYMLVEAALTTGGLPAPGRARVVLALEAAFGGTGAVAPDQQMVFARIRVRIDGAIPGVAYTFTHPYGVTDPLVADEDGRVFVTEDIGAVPLAFAEALTAPVAPFLRWTAGAPAGYLGDGVTPHAITGSPLGTNFVTIEGPGVRGPGGLPDPTDPANPDKVFTDLFTVQGRIATVAGVDVPRAVYHRDAAGAVTVDVFGSSLPGQALDVAGPGIDRTALTGAAGRYVTRAAAAAVPATVVARNTTDEPVSEKSAVVTDAVVITRAEYDLAARTLTVDATSSDAGPPPALTATGLGAITASPTVFAALDAPPPEVEVRSAAGGADVRTVTVVGPAAAPIPVAADAGPDADAVQGQTVTLDGSGSTGSVATFAWTGPVALIDAATPTPRFTAPGAPGPRTFTLDVTGPGGPSTDTVTITVLPAAPPVADAGPARSAGAGDLVALDGTGSAASTLAWTQQSGLSVGVITGADTATPSFTMPADTVVLRLTATGPLPPVATADVTVTLIADVLTVATAQFRTSKQQWRVGGTATGPLPDRVDVTLLDGAPGGVPVGSAAVDATGAWDLRRTVTASEPALRPAPGQSITVTTSRGASRALPVTIRN
jgi:hypothetical protein